MCIAVLSWSYFGFSVRFLSVHDMCCQMHVVNEFYYVWRWSTIGTGAYSGGHGVSVCRSESLTATNCSCGSVLYTSLAINRICVVVASELTYVTKYGSISVLPHPLQTSQLRLEASEQYCSENTVNIISLLNSTCYYYYNYYYHHHPTTITTKRFTLVQ